MQRYNIFRQLHKGLLCYLFETSLILQQNDFTSNDNNEEVLARLGILSEMFEQQYLSEQRLLLPAISKHDNALASVLETIQIEEQRAGQRLDAVVTTLKAACSSYEKDCVGGTIQELFNHFLCARLKGMEYREKSVNQLLWKLYNDETLVGISLRAGKGLTPELIHHFNRCMMRGLNNAEIISWMLRVKNYGPDNYFQQLLLLASNELTVQRWQLVQEALTEGIMVQ